MWLRRLLLVSWLGLLLSSHSLASQVSEQPDEAGASCHALEKAALEAFTSAALTHGQTQTFPASQSNSQVLIDRLLVALESEAEGLGRKEQWEKLSFKVQMGINEILQNAILVSIAKGGDKNFSLRYIVTGSRVEVVIADTSGRFFDAKDPNEPVNALKLRAIGPEDLFDTDGLSQRRQESGMHFREGAGGRGIFLAENYCTILRYEPHYQGQDVVGTAVTMIWDFN